MSAQIAVLRAPRPRLLRAAVRRMLAFGALVNRAQARRCRRLVGDARLRFEDRPWLPRERCEPRDDPRVHRWRPL